MAAAFDPYHKWLGIPASEQPPHHYRLLGIALYEDDADVITAAADRQMAHVRLHQTGPHAAASQQLLNELAAAKVCLLRAAKKAEYDTHLRARLSPANPPAEEHSAELEELRSVISTPEPAPRKPRQSSPPRQTPRPVEKTPSPPSTTAAAVNSLDTFRRKLKFERKHLQWVGMALVVVLGLMLVRKWTRSDADIGPTAATPATQNAPPPGDTAAGPQPIDQQQLAALYGPHVLRLGGGDRLEIAKSVGLAGIDTSFTAEMWIRVVRRDQCTCVLASMTGLGHETLRGGWSACIEDGKTHIQGGRGGGQSGGPEVPTDWFHYCVTNDAGRMRFATNGMEAMRAAAFNLYPATQSPLVLGAPRVAVDNPFQRAMLPGTIEFRSFHLSRGVRYPEKSFVPPQQFQSDGGTLVLMDFSREATTQFRDLSGQGHDGKFTPCDPYATPMVNGKPIDLDPAAPELPREKRYVRVPPPKFGPEMAVALQLELGDVVELANTAGLTNYNQKFTVELFFQNTNHECALLGSSMNPLHAAGGWNVQLARDLQFGGAALRTSFTTIRPEAPVALGDWYQNEWSYLCLLGDGKMLMTIVNGHEIVTRYYSPKVQPQMLKLYLGGPSLQKLSPMPFVKIRGFRMSRGLRYDPQEILDTGSNFLPPHTLPMDDHTEVLLDFSHAQGNVIRDLSGHGHDGAMHGGSWIEIPPGQ